MTLPDRIWSACDITDDDGTRHELGHCYLTVTEGIMRIEETYPVREKDGSRVPCANPRHHMYFHAQLIKIDHREATFTAEAASTSFSKDGSTTKTWPVTVVLSW